MQKIALTLIVIILSITTASASKIVGVTAFQNLSKKKNLSWLEVGIAESVSFKLRTIKKFIVIDRTNVDKVMSEIKLGHSGITDVNTAKKAGKALNADILVVGSFQAFGNKIRINARLIEVESHKILKQVQSTGTLNDIFTLQDEIALNIISEKNNQLTQKEKERITRKYTENISAYEYYSKGNKFYYKTNYKNAISMFKKAVNIDAQYSLAYAGLAKAYASSYWHLKTYLNIFDTSLLENSYKYSSKALSISPNLDEAHLSLAKYYQNVDTNKVKNKWAKCEEETKKTLEINPNNGEALFLMSRIYAYDDAKEEKYLKQALSKNAFLADAHNNLGIIYTNQNKYPEAIEKFERTIELDPDYITAYMNIGVVYDRQKEYDKALNMYKRIVKKYPKYKLGLVNLGIGYRRLEKYDEALKYFKRAVKVDPKYAFGLGEVAHIYMKKKKYNLAVTYYKKSLQYDYKNKYSLSNLAYTYDQMNNTSQAIYYLKKAIQYHKNYAWPYGYLGYVYRYKKKDKFEALKWYKKAARLDPNNSNYKSNIHSLESELNK